MVEIGAHMIVLSATRLVLIAGIVQLTLRDDSKRMVRTVGYTQHTNFGYHLSRMEKRLTVQLMLIP
jgi:hypothetical protein